MGGMEGSCGRQLTPILEQRPEIYKGLELKILLVSYKFVSTFALRNNNFHILFTQIRLINRRAIIGEVTMVRFSAKLQPC